MEWGSFLAREFKQRTNSVVWNSWESIFLSCLSKYDLKTGLEIYIMFLCSFCRSSLQKEPNLASIATNKAFAPSPLTSSDCNMPAPINSTGPVCVRRGGSYNGTSETSPHTPPVVSTASDCVQSSSSPSPPGLAPAPVQRAKSLESAFSGTPQMSAALPRGFRRSEATSRLSAGVTPKPFSTSRRSTQPRFYSVSAFCVSCPQPVYTFFPELSFIFQVDWFVPKIQLLFYALFFFEEACVSSSIYLYTKLCEV